MGGGVLLCSGAFPGALKVRIMRTWGACPWGRPTPCPSAAPDPGPTLFHRQPPRAGGTQALSPDASQPGEVRLPASVLSSVNRVKKISAPRALTTCPAPVLSALGIQKHLVLTPSPGHRHLASLPIVQMCTLRHNGAAVQLAGAVTDPLASRPPYDSGPVTSISHSEQRAP